jgi:hypothetical protein
VVPVRCGFLGGGVAETILGTKLFGYLLIDLSNVLVLLDLEEAAAGLVCHALEDLLAVSVGLVGGIGAGVVASTASRVAAAGVTAWIATTRIASSRVATAATLRIVIHGVVLFAFEVDGVDDGVGSLGGLDGFDEGFFALSVYAIGEDDDGFASGLFTHDLVRGEEEGVVKGGSTAVMSSTSGARVVSGAGAVAWGVNLAECFLEEGMGGSEVLQELRLVGELGNESLIFGGGEHLVKEGAAGGALLVDDVALGLAGVDQEAENEGKVGVFVEVTDGLGFAVDLKHEVILGEVLDERSFFVAHDDREIDEAGIDSEGSRRLGGGGSCGRLLRGKAGYGREKEAGEQETPGEKLYIHVRLDEVWEGWFQVPVILGMRRR